MTRRAGRQRGQCSFRGETATWPAVSIETDDTCFSGGAGIRFRLNQENRVNFRVDYAVGENDQDGFYVGVMEAF